MMDALYARRRVNWRQTPESRVPDPAAAAHFIEEVGVATLYPVSSEIPNLFHAYTGDAEAHTDSKWDSPSGEIYVWRWELGGPAAAFYTAIVRKRPTFVSWALLPAILRLCGDLRTPDELYDLGQISAGAHRIAAALEEHGPTLSTPDLRQFAGFPTGREQRAAYLRGVEELDSRLLLAKVFSSGNHEMRHALVAVRYPEHVAVAEALSYGDALYWFLLAYLRHAAFIVPATLVRHLKLSGAHMTQALARLQDEGRLQPGPVEHCYSWKES